MQGAGPLPDSASPAASGRRPQRRSATEANERMRLQSLEQAAEVCWLLGVSKPSRHVCLC